jgi:hypothetical protein
MCNEIGTNPYADSHGVKSKSSVGSRLEKYAKVTFNLYTKVSAFPRSFLFPSNSCEDF